MMHATRSFMTPVDIMEAADDIVDMAADATTMAEVLVFRAYHEAYVEMVQRMTISGKHRLWLH